MSNPDQWLKLHTSLLTSAKWTALPTARDRLLFIVLMMLCKKGLITENGPTNAFATAFAKASANTNAKGFAKSVEILTKHGLIKDNLWVIGFEDSQLSGSAVRMRKMRQRHSDGHSDRTVTGRREKRDKTPISPSEIFPGKEQKKTKKVREKDVAEVLTYLNSRAGRRVTVDAMIRKRLKNGGDVETMKAVIDLKAKEWGADEKMRRYLHPDTLFNRSKYAKYVDEVNEWRDENEPTEFL